MYQPRQPTKFDVYMMAKALTRRKLSLCGGKEQATGHAGKKDVTILFQDLCSTTTMKGGRETWLASLGGLPGPAGGTSSCGLAKTPIHPGWERRVRMGLDSLIEVTPDFAV